jgi:MATE family multidrug resistance protein
MFKRWNKPYGYKDVLGISLPLVASMSSTTVMHFTDRVFLGNYSLDTLAAAMPAVITAFMFQSFFFGVAVYANTFIAQYIGAGAHKRVGASLWQAIYFSLASGLLLAALYFVAEPIFRYGGHTIEVQRLEVTYFRILTLGAVFSLLGVALSCFYSGRGLTRTVMFVNCIGAAVNIPLDYALINGVWGFPELGIAGAGIATVIASAVIALLYAVLIFNRKNDENFGVWLNRAFDRELFRRLMKYGLPGGVQFFIDIFAFTLFLFVVGRLGKVELAATNIAFSISTLTFMPMIGFAQATTILVGQAIGRDQPEDGCEITINSLHLTVGYMALIALVLVLMPEWLLDMFKSRDHTEGEYEIIKGIGVILLRFVAFFCLFDALNLIYAATIKGAGDTRFVMWTIGLMSTGIMVLPVYIGVEFMGAGLYTAWVFATLYICLLGFVFRWRYRQGKWKKMRVIEAGHFPILQQSPASATVETL